jgi:PiT family inorganic phosphate transporter
VLDVGLVFVCVLVLGAEFVNGFTDAPNAIATVVSTRVLKPLQAVGMAITFNVVGAMVGTAVAKTIGKGIVQSEIIGISTIGYAMVGIIVWSTVAWIWGLPTSESHALVAGLTGAALAQHGPSVLLWDGWKKVIIGLGFSTFLGFFFGLGLMSAISNLFSRKSPIFFRKTFGKLQVLSAAFMAFGHGTNDGQKFIGVLTLALFLGGVIPEFAISKVVILTCAVVMGIGTTFGGWRIIKTMGLRLTKLDPVHGFAAETGAACAIQLATSLGIPLSTTHTINTAIMGVGSTKRFSAVRWGVGRTIVLAWVLTFPICGAIAYGLAGLGELIK